jgi:TrmH family RNA methyltransferase
LVEGPQAVRELVLHRAELVRDIYVTDAVLVAYPAIVDAALEAELFVHPVTDEVAAAISQDSQGIAAVTRMWDVGAVSFPESPRLVAIFSTVRDPGNAGTAIRVADAAGANLVVLAGESVDVFNPKVVRATAGSLFHVPVLRGVSVADAVTGARAAGLQVLAADGGGELELGGGAGASGGADNAFLALPTAWLFGNEAHGLSAEELALADHSVRIPIFGKAESLNLAAAAAVALYASALAQH